MKRTLEMQPAQPPVVPATATVGKAHTIPWVLPWAFVFAANGAGRISHALWGDDPTWPAVIMTLAVIGVAYLTAQAGRARGPVIRAHAVASVLGYGFWLVAATVTGAGAPVTGDLWWLLFASPLSWNIHRWLRRGDGGPGSGNGWGQLREEVNIAGTRVRDYRHDGPRVHATIEADRFGGTAADLKAVPRKAAVWLGLAESQVTMTPDPTDAGMARMTVITENLLAKPRQWPGLSSPGGCITEPIPLGDRENGDTLYITLPAQPHLHIPAQHVLLAGMTGSGKSRAGMQIASEVASRHNSELHIIDIEKGAQFVGPFINRERVYLYRTPEEARQAISGLRERLRARSDHLGEMGLENWQPGCGLLYEVWLIEEAGSGLGTSKVLADIGKLARSTGVSLIISTQRVTTASIHSDLRKQIATILQFGCMPEHKAADYALSDAVMEAGAAPQNWGNDQPGMVYGQVPGTPSRLWHLPCRVWDATPMRITAALTGYEPDEEVELPGSVSALKAKALFKLRLEALHAEQRTVIRPADFDDMLAQAGRSRPWLTLALKQAVKSGVLIGGNGVYQFPGMMAAGKR